MVRSVIKRDGMSPDVLRGVEVADRMVQDRLRVLEPYDITATWWILRVDDEPTAVCLDLTARHNGREYGVKGKAYPPAMFSDPKLTKLPRFWEQEWAFIEELSRLNLDDLKEQQNRAGRYETAGVE